jgi:hypothetical protein
MSTNGLVKRVDSLENIASSLELEAVRTACRDVAKRAWLTERETEQFIAGTIKNFTRLEARNAEWRRRGLSEDEIRRRTVRERGETLDETQAELERLIELSRRQRRG